MKKSFIAWLSVLFLVCVVNVESGVEAAEKFPSKPVTFIMPLEAGSGADIATRPFCEKLGAALGQPVVMVNKPGAGSSIGYRAVHDAKPDGYTIGSGQLTLITNKLQGLLPYDYHDFTVMGTIQIPTPVIVASTKGKRNFTTLKEFVDFAKSHPGEVSVAAGGKGQSVWIYAMEFQSITGTQFNIVPQAGAGGASVTQAAGGHVEIAFGNLTESKSQIEAGNLRLLAFYGERKPSGFAEIPTTKELGINCRGGSLNYIVGPANIPKEITDILVKAIEIASKDPAYRKYIEEKTFSVPIYWDPDQTMKEVDKQRDLIRGIMEKAGILKEK